MKTADPEFVAYIRTHKIAVRASADYELVQQQRIESLIAGPLNLTVDPTFKNDLLAVYAQENQSDEAIPAVSAVNDLKEKTCRQA